MIQPAVGSTGYVADIDTNLLILDTRVMFSDDPVHVRVTPSGGGNFTVAHGLTDPTGNPRVPNFVMFQMTSGGQMWLQDPIGFDNINVYGVASDSGISGYIVVW